MRSLSCCRCRSGSKPRTETTPPLRGRNPSRISTVVVLPAPFGPSRPNTSPGWISKSMPFTACTSPYDFVRPCTEIAGAAEFIARYVSYRRTRPKSKNPPYTVLMYGPFARANRWRTGRALKLRLAQLRDPQPRVDVVEIHQAIEQVAVARHRARLPSPGEWQIRPVPLGVAGPEAGNLAALAVEIAAQFAGDVEHPRSAAIVTLIEHIVRRPEIVRSPLRHFILRHFPRMFDVGNIHDVADGTHRDALLALEFKNGGKHFVPHKKIILVPEHAMRTRQPTISIQFVMVEVVLADQLGILRAAAAHAVAHIEDDQSISPVRQVSQAVFHLQVMQVPSAGHRSVHRVNADGGRILRFPARHFLGMFRILKINDAERSRGIVGDVYVVAINVGAMHSTRDRRRIFG